MAENVIKPSKKRKTYEDRKDRLTFGRVFVMCILFLGAIIVLIPLVWTICMSLKPDGEMYNGLFFPQSPDISNYAKALTSIDFFRYLGNTLIIVIPNVIGTTMTSALVAYGFSRFNFKGKRIWFLILLSTMMLPGQITMIPQFLMFRAFGWVNTPLPLIIPAFFGGGAFNIFLIRQFMGGIPKDFDEAAKIDGASSWRTFSHIIMPMCKPAITAVGIFTFMGCWNDFQGPLIYLTSSTKFTLSIGLSFFKGMYTSHWNLLMAATVMVMLPILVLFFIAQDYIIDGISISSGTKG